MRGAVAVALAALAAASAARAATTVPLPSPLQALSPTPPLAAAAGFASEAGSVVHQVPTTQRVTVKLDRRGTPFAIDVRQTLRVLGKGDYVYVIPGPIADVRPIAGSDSSPGLRRDAVLWTGFSAGERVLAARVVLRAGPAAASLPLRVLVRRGSVTLVNATGVSTGSYVADARAAPLRAYLARVARNALAGELPPPGVAIVTGRLRASSEVVESPLRVTGTVSGRRVDLTLGDGRPLRVTVPVPEGPPRIRLTVAPVPPARLLRAPTADLDGQMLLARANAVLHRIARARQYDTFLATPDPRGARKTTYVYVTAARTRAAPAALAPPEDGGLPGLLVAALAVAAAAAGLVVWARS